MHDRQIPVYEAAINSPKPPTDPYFHQQYLTALTRAGRDTDADKVVNAWLAPTLKLPLDLTPVELARAMAAAQYMTGNLDGGYGYANALDEKWLGPLATLVRSSAGSQKTLGIAQTSSAGRFNNDARALRARH
jgi:hypothetical protein